VVDESRTPTYLGGREVDAQDRELVKVRERRHNPGLRARCIRNHRVLAVPTFVPRSFLRFASGSLIVTMTGNMADCVLAMLPFVGRRTHWRCTRADRVRDEHENGKKDGSKAGKHVCADRE
jgi:hypothetical protein